MLFYYLRKRGQSSPPTFKAISAILVVMWIFAAGILTFDYPFIPTGNGFFASWLGLFASCSVCYGEFCGQDVRPPPIPPPHRLPLSRAVATAVRS